MRMHSLLLLLLASSSLCAGPHRAAAQTASPWLPVTKEELEMKDNALQPGEPAMYLYREIHTDNTKSFETHYIRIKIFKDEGKKYADIEIPYVDHVVQVEEIQARTVTPDGKPADFAGTIFDKIVAKTRRFRVNVKSFTLANVQAGSIIEYTYRFRWHRGIPDEIKNPQRFIFEGAYAYPAAGWTIERDLFVRRLRLVLHPVRTTAHIEIRSVMMPQGSAPQRLADGNVQLEIENIPAAHSEEHSPPRNAMEPRAFVFYTIGFYSNEGYWNDLARRQAKELEKFLTKSRAVQQEVARLIAPDDSPETKLRKLYQRVQQIRYISYETRRTEKERKQENLKPNRNVEEVLTRGYAFANEINMMFVAMAREAGFQAFIARVTSRDRNLFIAKVPDPNQLDAEVVEVQLPSKNLYLDPATLHCPFGILPWEESNTEGIRLNAFSGAVVHTPPPRSSDAVIERRSNLKLEKDGSLHGTLEASFLGQEALQRRLKANNTDEAARKKGLEDEARAWLPARATATMISAAGWEGSDGAVKAKFEIEVPNFGVQAGERLLLPVVVFQTRLTKSFRSAQRENAVYFDYAYQELDEVTLEVPEGYKVENLPTTRSANDRIATYELATDRQGAQLSLKRRFTMESHFFPLVQYPMLRNFMDYVRGNDEEQVVLHVIK